MSRVIIFLCVVFFVGCDTASNIDPPDQSYFVKYFGRDGNQTAVDMVVDVDGTIYILGNSQRTSTSRQQIYLAKANSRGQLLKDTLLTDLPVDAKDIEFTLTGELIIVANQLDTINGDMNVLVKKLSKDFVETGSEILWSRDVLFKTDPYSNPHKNDFVNSITPLANGNFILTGYTDNSEVGHQLDILNLQIDQNLAKVLFPWGEVTGAGMKNYGRKVIESIQSMDTVRYLFGDISSPQSDQNVWYGILPKNSFGGNNFDNQSNTIFTSPLTDDIVTNVIGYSYGYFITSVGTTSSGSSTLKLYDIGFKTPDPGSATGDVTSYFEWPLGTVSNADAITCKAHIGFLVVADFSRTANNTDILFLKLDGSLKNPIYFGGNGNDRASEVVELPDGRVLILGTMQLGNPPEQYKIALIKVNSDGKFQE